MTNTWRLPVTVDGVRLDTKAYTIERLTGLRSLPRTRSGDVVVPGLHGVVASRYDDYEPGEIALRMWVRDVDEDGRPVSGDVHRRQQLDRNLDKLFALFRTRQRLLDVRMQVGRDGQAQYSVVRNPRCERGTTASSDIRTNTVVNPSFDRSTTFVALRENLCENPSFEVDTAGWSATAGSVARSTQYATVGSACGQLTLDGSSGPALLYTRTMPITPGDVYSASAMVGALQSFPGRSATIHARIEWLDGSGQVISADDGQPVTALSTTKFSTGAPVWTPVDVSSAAPEGAASVRLAFVVTQSVSVAGDKFVVDQVLLERTATPGPYFDGDQDGASWTGTPHASTSAISEPAPDNWAAGSGVLLLQDVKRVGPWFGSATGEVTAVTTVPAGTAIVWQAGTLPAASLSPSGQWSAGIQVRAATEPAPRLRLRIAGLDGGGAFVGYARTGSPTGPEAMTVIEPTTTWWRWTLEGVYLPEGATQARLELQTEDEAPEGTVWHIDAAILEPNPTTPQYFDGDSGPDYHWSGLAHASPSALRAANVADWQPEGGTFVVAAEAPTYPVEAARAHGLFTVTASGAQGVVSAVHTPETAVRPWCAGVYVWGRDGVTHARVRVEALDGADTVLGSSPSAVVPVAGGWQWVACAPWTPPAGTVRVRMRVTFHGDQTGSEAPTNGVAWVTGAMLATADGEHAKDHTPTGDDYFDETTPGATILPNGVVRRLPQVRQALCKTVDAVVPDVEGGGPYVARMNVLLEIPAAFWQDPDWLVWEHQVTGGSGAWSAEITNLRGATAPIEDAVIIVYGPASNPRLTDPESGGWVQLNGTIPAGQAWRVDAGRDRSGVGSATLDPHSDRWDNRRGQTDWRSPRARLFVLHPEWDPARGDHIVRLQVSGTNRVRVIARRKWL